VKALVITSRDLEKSSTKYRLAQYIEFLKSKRIHFEFVKKMELDASVVKRVSNVDLLINQRCLFQCSLASRLIDNSRRVLFDFDDAIYTRPGKPYSLITSLRVRRRLNLWLKRSHTVTISSNFLGRYARRYSNNVEVVPMALDLDTWKPREKSPDGNVTIGWAGAPVNLKLVERLDTVLGFLVKKYPFLKLAIFSGEKPRLSCPFEYQPYRPGREVAFVQNLDIGLLPLIDQEFYLGKSPIKAIQYLACGVPVVGNVMGATCEILNEKNSIRVSTEKDWKIALERLINNPDLSMAMGRAGREHVKKNHNFQVVAEQLFRVLSGK
jgi:glycosyltransferase involved in cell wall biosynthesis